MGFPGRSMPPPPPPGGPPPKKKPGLDVVIGIGGKPKSDAGGPQPPPSYGDPPSDEPGADDSGAPMGADQGQSDDDSGQAMQYAQEIVSDPDVGPAFTQFLEAMWNKLRGGSGGQSPDDGSAPYGQ